MIFANLSTDILTLIIIAVLFLASLKFGRKLMVTSILALYPVIIIFNNFSYINFDSIVIGFFSFLAFLIAGIIIIWPNLNPKNALGKIKRYFDYFLLSLVFVVILISISNESIFYLDYIFEDQGYIHNWISQIPFIISASLPIVAILITNKRNRY